MTKSDLAIWWTNQSEANAIHDGDLGELPAAIANQLWSRIGRNGRGRLWVAAELESIPDVSVSPWPTSSMATYLSESCGGVVIRRSDIDKVNHLPGTITDFDLKRLP